MAVPTTNIHGGRLVDQIRFNLVGLQHDMVNNAKTWKGMATAQSPPLATLQQFMHDAAAAYSTRLGWYVTLQTDSAKHQRVLDQLAKMNWLETDITDVATALQTVATQLAAAPLASYATIINVCDNIVAAVNPPDSLWPE